MKRQLTALLMTGVFLAGGDAARAHHSFTMFDGEHPIEIEGVVQEFKYSNPHSYLLLEVKSPDGSAVIWNLEGSAPAILSRSGWTKDSLKPGDEVILTIDPLRSGAPGGSWQRLKQIKFKDGRPITP